MLPGFFINTFLLNREGYFVELPWNFDVDIPSWDNLHRFAPEFSFDTCILGVDEILALAVAR